MVLGGGKGEGIERLHVLSEIPVSKGTRAPEGFHTPLITSRRACFLVPSHKELGVQAFWRGGPQHWQMIQEVLSAVRS